MTEWMNSDLERGFLAFCLSEEEQAVESKLNVVIVACSLLNLSRQRKELETVAAKCQSLQQLHDEYLEQHHETTQCLKDALKLSRKDRNEIESLKQALQVRQAFDEINDLHHRKTRIQKELQAEIATRRKVEQQLESLRGKLLESQVELARETENRRQAQRSLEKIGNSVSWKITEPLRVTKKLVLGNELSRVSKSIQPKVNPTKS
jgi:chromosome segregation ATPase